MHEVLLTTTNTTTKKKPQQEISLRPYHAELFTKKYEGVDETLLPKSYP